MKYIAIFLLFFIIGCKKKEGLELEILTKEVNYLNVTSEQARIFLHLDSINQKAKTIIDYKLTNNSDKTYYFNLYSANLPTDLYKIKMDKSFVAITDSSGKKVRTGTSSSTTDLKTREYIISNLLNNNYFTLTNNFIIHPNETLFFKWFIVLPYGNMIEENNYSLFPLDTKNKYFAELYIKSTNSKKEIPNNELKTIEKNGYEIYNGEIKSKNKIPVKFLNP